MNECNHLMFGTYGPIKSNKCANVIESNAMWGRERESERMIKYGLVDSFSMCG